MGQKKILLIDDSSTQTMYEKMMLGDAYQVITASNGRLGIAAAIKEKPDLILMDIVMPEMDGVECLRSIRAMDPIKNIPIIMVTTKADESRVTTCFNLGCNDFLSKPVDRNELLNKVNKILNGNS